MLRVETKERKMRDIYVLHIDMEYGKFLFFFSEFFLLFITYLELPKKYTLSLTLCNVNFAPLVKDFHQLDSN